MSKKECCTNPRLGKVGGQAVLEGVMMKSKSNIVATSVRKPDGTIASATQTFTSIRSKNKFYNLPIIRGVVNLIEMYKLSMKTLTDSTTLAGLDEIEPETKFEKWLDKKFGKHLTETITGVGLFLGIALALVIFFWLPQFLARLLNGWLQVGEIWESVFSSVIKIIIFIVYIWVVSLMKDIRRTFEYHGAEHKTIFCYESGEDLTVENVKKQSRFHPRCGTSFLFVMLIIGMVLALGTRILIINVIGFTITNKLLNALFYTGISIVILLPLIAGIGFEFLMYAGKHTNLFVKILSAPGLWMQRLTTREPDEKQIEVAITSLKLALPDEYPPEETPAEEPAEEAAAENAAE